MWRYLGWRLLRALGTVAGVVTVVFLLVRMVPGDPVDAILGERAAEEDRELLRERLHLNASLPEQYIAFLADVADGSLGQSFRQPDRTVGSLIGHVMTPTALLALAALLVAWVLAIPLGILAAAKRGTSWDRSASAFAVLGLAIPNIWLGPLLVLFFAVQLRWLPMPGDSDEGLVALVLPSITLGTALAAMLTRQTRAAMCETLEQPFIVAARARGVSEAQVMLQALRNSLLPVVTVGAAQVGALLSGTVVVEKIFEREGLGTLFLDAFFARDLPVVQGCVLMIGLIYVLVNLAVDIAYGAIDPRVRLDRA